MDEAVLTIQEAANKIVSVSSQMEGFEGKQNELLASVKVLTECVTDMEHGTRDPVLARNKHSVALYDRVSLCSRVMGGGGGLCGCYAVNLTYAETMTNNYVFVRWWDSAFYLSLFL